MSEDEAIRIATEHAARHGREPADYEVMSVTRPEGQYVVLFQGVSGQPGDHFSVYVDETSARATRMTSGR